MSQTPPPMAPPPPQPQWTPPPQQPMGWGGPAYGGPPPRPTGVLLAAIYLILMGLFVAGILGGCSLLGAAVISTTGSATNSSLGGAIGAGVSVFAIGFIIVGILQIAAGAGSIGGSSWARWLGVIMSVIGVLLFGLLAVLAFTDRNGTGLGIFFAVPAILYALCAFALFSAGAFFSYRR